LSETDPAAKRGCRVPAEHEEAVTVKEEPEAAEGVKMQLVAVPRLVKSAAARPETLLEKVRV
jgi:organic hydroperoxide reductase OsmC/OhrA